MADAVTIARQKVKDSKTNMHMYAASTGKGVSITFTVGAHG